MQAVMEKMGDVTVILVPREALAAGNSKEFTRDIDLALSVNPRVVFDLKQLQVVDRSGLEAMISCLIYMTSVGGDLKLCQLSGPVRALFETAHLHRVFDIFNTREEAVSSFHN